MNPLRDTDGGSDTAELFLVHACTPRCCWLLPESQADKIDQQFRCASLRRFDASIGTVSQDKEGWWWFHNMLIPARHPCGKERSKT